MIRSAVSEVDEKERTNIGGLREAASSSTDLTPEFDTTGNVTYCKLDEVPTELESESEAGVRKILR